MTFALLALLLVQDAPDTRRFTPADVFALEWASDPQISPDGSRVVYVRNFFDKMNDQARSNLWLVGTDGNNHRPLTTGLRNDSSPRWAPDGNRIAFLATADDKPQLHCLWTDTGQLAQLTRGDQSPGTPAWSRDGEQLAFSMFVPSSKKPLIEMPKKPAGAQWADDAKVIDEIVYRRDGSGYVKPGYRHLFVLPALGGTPRQVTTGDYHHDGTPLFDHEGDALIFSANRHDDWRTNPLDGEIYEVALDTGEVTALTDRRGPDEEPALSPDGAKIAYTGFDD